MEEKRRVFTVAEANALLPRLNVLLERALRVTRELDAHADALRALGVDPEEPDEAEGDGAEVASHKRALRGLLEDFRAGLTELEATGVVVKDLRAGLLDFYGRVEGRLVWLCWRYGEPAVAHWHALDTGFAARKPLPRTSIPPTMN